jgi:hypothetical protein
VSGRVGWEGGLSSARSVYIRTTAKEKLEMIEQHAGRTDALTCGLLPSDQGVIVSLEGLNSPARCVFVAACSPPPPQKPRYSTHLWAAAI